METVTKNEVITVHKFGFSSTCPEVSTNVPPNVSYIFVGSKNDPADAFRFSEETVLNDLNNLYLGFSDPWLCKGRAGTSKHFPKQTFTAEVTKSPQENVLDSEIVKIDRLERSKPIMFPVKCSPDKTYILSSSIEDISIPEANKCDQNLSIGDKQKMEMVFSALDPRTKIGVLGDSSDEDAAEKNSGKNLKFD